MSQIMNELRRVARPRAGLRPVADPQPAIAPERGYRVLTVTSNKGGVGKTTLATNLAVYFRALREDVPVLVMSLDDQDAVDRMFELAPGAAAPTVADALRAGSFEGAIRLGQYGVHYVPSSSRIAALKAELADPFQLGRALLATGWRGLVVIDTKSDLEILTRNAIAASDLAVVVVQDRTSLIEACKVYELLDELGLPRDRARILLSLVDLRIKFQEGADGDVLGLLVSEVRRLGHPLFETFVSRSPKIEALYTNPEGRAHSILDGAPGSLVHRQLHCLADDVLASLDLAAAEPEDSPPVRYSVVLAGLTPEAVAALPTNPFEIDGFPFDIGRESSDEPNDLAIRDTPPCQVSRKHAQLVAWAGGLGIRDRGSRLGTLVNGRRIGGTKGDTGPVPLAGDGGILVLGTAQSRMRFSVAVRQHAAEGSSSVPARPGPFKSFVRRSIRRWA